MLNNNIIKVAMLEMSPQNKAILEFYFDRAGKSLYKVAHKDAADALIIDYDQFGAKEHVSEILAERNIPILLISIKEQDIASTIWLAKPLSADALSKAAGSVKELLLEIEEKTETAIEIEAEAEAEAEKTTVAAEEVEIESETEVVKEASAEDENIEVLSEMHLEEDELFLDDSIEEMSKSDEKATTEKLLEIDELTVENSLVEEHNVESQSVEEHSIEKQKVEESTFADSGLAIAGVAATGALVTSLLDDDNDADDSSDDVEVQEQELFELDEISIEDNAADTSLDLDVATEEDSFAVLDEDDEVDSLLDSLISEEDETEQALEESVEETNEDAFLDNLLLDPELENSADDAESTIEAETNDTSLEIDVLKSVDSELEDNLSLQNTIPPIIENEVETTEINSDSEVELVDENFTLHDDLDPSTEDVFAETLELKYDEVKDANEEATNNLEVTETLNEASADLGETTEGDFNFDFESLENKEFLNEETTEQQTESLDDFELTLLDEVDKQDENDINADLSTHDDSDADLDSLLEQVSEENDEADAASINTLETEDEPELGAITSTEVETAVATANDDEDLDDFDVDLPDDDLQSLLNEVREEANSSVDNSNSVNDTYEQTQAEKRWMQLCGNEQIIKSQKEVAKNSFDAEKHLLGVILKQIKTTENKEQLFRLKYNDLIVVIDHSQSKVYCNTPITSDEFSVFCTNELDPSKIKIHDLDYSEERLYRNKIEKNPNRAHTFESFIWTTSLLTSRGRLPVNTSLSKNIGLKTWPNLTRLEAIPHAMNIAAVFAKHPGTLLEVPNWLNIQQRYVFAFYNAASALDMIEFDSKKAKKPGFSFGKKASEKNSEERGFFGRLLKRLKT